MKVTLRTRAARDIREAHRQYEQDAGAVVAARFLARVERAVEQARRQPLSGSPRLGRALRFPGLRAVLLEGFPWTLFYVVAQRSIDVVRVLPQRADLPKHLR
jgi:plasmid stabilization system protein ParE